MQAKEWPRLGACNSIGIGVRNGIEAPLSCRSEQSDRTALCAASLRMTYRLPCRMRRNKGRVGPFEEVHSSAKD